MIPVDDLARQTGPIRFTRFELFRVAIPMREPFRISSGEVACKEAAILRAWDGDLFGWGESSAMPGGFYSSETPESCWRELTDTVLPALTGREFPHIAVLDAWLREHTTTPFVRVAVETAAWEIAARGRGLSLRALFGLADRPIPSGLAVGLRRRSRRPARGARSLRPARLSAAEDQDQTRTGRRSRARGARVAAGSAALRRRERRLHARRSRRLPRTRSLRPGDVRSSRSASTISKPPPRCSESRGHRSASTRASTAWRPRAPRSISAAAAS